MKKFSLIFLAALFSLTSCNKEIVDEVFERNNDVVLSFTSERPQLDEIGTRTAWDNESSSIVWSVGDKIRVGYTLDDEWMGQTVAGTAKFYQSEEVEIDKTNASIGTFKVPISGSAFTDPEEAGSYVFYSLYPASLLSDTSVGDAPIAKVTLKSSQNPTAASFEGATDLMVGKTAEMSLEKLPTEPIEINWNRVVAHGYFTLKDLQGVLDGESITKVTFTAQKDAVLAGEIFVSLEDGSFKPSNTTNEIVINGSNLAFVEESGMTNLKVWLSVLPATLESLKVSVETNKATYVREITGISKTLKKNARNVLSINMSSATKTEVEQVEWVKKDITAINASDVFVIVGNNGKNYALNSSNGTSSAPVATEVTVDGNKLASNPIDEIQWTLESSADGYVFYPNGSSTTWLYVINNNNGLRVGNTTTGKYWNLDATSGYLVGTDPKPQSRYLGIYNSQDWRSYTSIGSNIKDQTFAFYVKTAAGDIKETPTLTFNEPTTTVNVGKTVINVATIDPSTLTVTYSSSNEEVATVAENGIVTGVGAGTATITASFAGNDSYEAVSQSYEIKVVSDQASTIAEVIAASNGANVNTAGVVAQKNQKGFILTDGHDNILVYQNAVPTVELGQAVTVSGTRGAYNNIAQITSPTITEGETGQTIPRTDLTIVTSANVTSFTTSVYVSLTGTLTISGNYYNISLPRSSIQGSLYQLAGSETFTAGKVSDLDGMAITVYGYVTGRTNNYLNIAPVDIELDYSPALSITPATSSDSPAAWASGAGDAKSFTVTPTNGTWDYTSTDMDWATISQSGNVLTVTPKTAQATKANSGTITVTLTPSQSGYSSITETIYLAQAKYVSGTSQVTLQYTGTTTTNMTGSNDAAMVGLDATKWSVVGDKGGSSNLPGLNKDGTIRLYYHANGNNTITVTSSTGTINSIILNYNGTYNNGKVFVGEDEVTASNGSYPINNTSFVIANGNTTNVQVHIKSIEITYTPSN